MIAFFCYCCCCCFTRWCLFARNVLTFTLNASIQDKKTAQIDIVPFWVNQLRLKVQTDQPPNRQFCKREKRKKRPTIQPRIYLYMYAIFFSFCFVSCVFVCVVQRDKFNSTKLCCALSKSDRKVRRLGCEPKKNKQKRWTVSSSLFFFFQIVYCLMQLFNFYLCSKYFG